MKISCIIPCFEEERMVHFAIKSAVSFADEVLVFDDSSMDNSYSQILVAQDKWPNKVKVFTGRIRKNPDVRNELIKRSKHEIIVCMDADIVFIPEMADKFTAFLSRLKPQTFYRFGNLEISRDLRRTTKKIFGPKDVGFSCFLKSDDMHFYCDEDGFAKFKAKFYEYPGHIFTIHFKFNKSPERIAKRCVYRESVRTERTMEELFEERYSGKAPKINSIDADIGPPVPDEYARLDVYREVLDYADRYYDLFVG